MIKGVLLISLPVALGRGFRAAGYKSGQSAVAEIWYALLIERKSIMEPRPDTPHPAPAHQMLLC